MAQNALIIVDMLNDFLDPKGALYCGDAARKIIPFVRDRIRTHEARGDLILYLKDSHDEDDAEFDKFPKHCVAGTWGAGIVPEVAPGSEAKVVSKKRYSGFYGTDLHEILKAAEVRHAEVVGVCTSICVMDTVGGLADRDIAVRVPVKGVADFDPEFHDFALRRMRKLYGADVS